MSWWSSFSRPKAPCQGIYHHNLTEHEKCFFWTTSLSRIFTNGPFCLHIIWVSLVFRKLIQHKMVKTSRKGAKFLRKKNVFMQFLKVYKDYFEQRIQIWCQRCEFSKERLQIHTFSRDEKWARIGHSGSILYSIGMTSYYKFNNVYPLNNEYYCF